MTKVLVTGGTGFVAGHVIDTLLKRGHSVITTVRSQEKAQAVLDAYTDVSHDNFNTVIVPDIAAHGAFEGLSSLGLEAVIHVASPFHYNVTDPKKDLIDPAVLGTTGVLKAIKDSCPNVKRVVVTSSFAAILNPGLASMGAEKTYSEEDWSPVTLEDAYSNGMMAYVASKVFAERAAWNFIETEQPSFTLSTICPPMIYGPVKLPVKSLSAINTSNKLLAEVILGKHKAGLPPTGLPLWVDVRDVALAHVRAMEVQGAGGKRFLTTAGFYSNEEMANALWNSFPSMREKLPEPGSYGGAPSPALRSFGYNTSRAKEILGLQWTPYERTVVDSTISLDGLEE
ncbi:ketoreductase [Colletotrichum lupini]|uniref:Ketoreductase n=1 Tax=Colletotrichum lupini TaxID=145971 RepID=A0A9Q8T513_9PEZI|nr:ketoreductase [Colletotrichum lupini]KAK1702731.1 ketoreductase [Colletotrichum lupini]UQC89028.1 ketoreductase [Colletotrichum lupini]